jgi:serine/threonine protein kinase
MLALGQYHLDETLGTSVHGVTYAGRRQQSPVVVKVYEVDADLPTPVRRQITAEFQQRAQLAATLYHPNIVPLRDFGVASPYLYAVSGLLVAGSLSDAEGQRVMALPLARQSIVGLVVQLGQALLEAHRGGIAHGNIRPSNIFLNGYQGENVRVQLGDFLLVSEHSHGLVVPTIRGREQPADWSFTAPEQRNARPTPAGDQYALAALVHYWLTGYPPSDDPIQRAVSPAASQISPDIWTVLSRGLHDTPSERYASIATFSRVLIAALEGRPTAELAAIAAQPEDSTTGSIEIYPSGSSNGKCTTIIWRDAAS